MGPYLGDFTRGQSVHFAWDSNSSAGASITRGTNGTVSVYKNNGTTQSTTGVTDTEDFDSLTGVHACTIDLSADASFYSPGANFTVILSAATIDSQTVNAVLAHFSVENRDASVVANGTVSAYTDPTNVTLPTGLNVRQGSFFYANGGTGAGSGAIINSYNSGTGATVFEESGVPAALDSTTTFKTAIPMDASGYPEVNAQYMNDAEILGDGSSGNKWRGA
jgi:hypothetical protein